MCLRFLTHNLLNGPWLSLEYHTDETFAFLDLVVRSNPVFGLGSPSDFEPVHTSKVELASK